MSGMTHTAVANGTASVLALAANSGRKWALFQNDSDVVMYLNLGSAAVANTGIRLSVGASYEIAPYLNNLTQVAIYSIASSSAKNLLVTENSQ